MAAAAATAPPFYFCNVATSKREPADRQSVSEKEASEGRKLVASWRGRAGRLQHQGLKSRENKSKTAKCARVCSLACAYIVCISVFCCRWQNETRLQEQLSSEPTAASRQQIPEITCNGWSRRSGDTGADLLPHIKPKPASSIVTNVWCTDPSRVDVTLTKNNTLPILPVSQKRRQKQP